jgi:Zn-dependent protease
MGHQHAQSHPPNRLETWDSGVAAAMHHGRARMETTRDLFRVWGIPIRVHPSWLVIFALVSWSLAAGYFPATHPGWSAPTYWLAGTITSLLLFASVVVHELGHAWVARRAGLPISGITLFLFGGVARMVREPSAPGVELRIAVAGPITSLALALGFAMVWVVAQPLEVVAAAALWLARINMGVALFNLVPGFPLDGGRVLRAVVWWWTGRFRDASRVAAQSGQVVALGFIGLGILLVLRGQLLNGVWTAFVGWFLQSAAASTFAETDLRERLQQTTVSRAMTGEYRRVPPAETLERLVQDEVLGAGRRCFLVMEGARLVGLVTLHDVRAVPRERWADVTVAQAMTPAVKLTTAAPGEPLLAALERMDTAEVAQLPVVEGDAVRGLIAREHVLRYVGARAELGV